MSDCCIDGGCLIDVAKFADGHVVEPGKRMQGTEAWETATLFKVANGYAAYPHVRGHVVLGEAIFDAKGLEASA